MQSFVFPQYNNHSNNPNTNSNNTNNNNNNINNNNFNNNNNTHQPPMDPFSMMFNTFFGNSVPMNQMFASMGIHSNPADYGIGRNFNDLLNQLFESSSCNGAPPACKSAIEKLACETATQCHTEDECPICKDNFEVGNKMLSMPCNHNFHKDCIVKWLEMHNNCPVCRSQLK